MWGQNGKTNFACLDCRRVASSPSWFGPLTCPSCRKPMLHMGVNFKAPRRSATAQWEKVRRLRETGCYFVHQCARPFPHRGHAPIRTLSDAKSALRQRRSDRKPPSEPERVPKRSHLGYRAVRSPR